MGPFPPCASVLQLYVPRSLRAVCSRAALALLPGAQGGSTPKAAALEALESEINAATQLYMQLIVGIRAAAEAAGGPTTSQCSTLAQCFLYLGDLTRYRDSGSDAAASHRIVAQAASFYQVAALLSPRWGNPHNQLAVLCLSAKDDLTAVYRYARSLASATPFPTARDNLMQVLERNRQQVAGLAGSPQIKAMRSWGSSTLDVPSVAPGADTEAQAAMQEALRCQRALRGWTLLSWVRLSGMLWTSSSTERIPGLLRDAVEDVCRLIRHKGMPMPPSSVLLPMAGLALFCEHSVEAGGARAVMGATVNPQRKAAMLSYSQLAVLTLLGSLMKEAGKPLAGAQKALRTLARATGDEAVAAAHAAAASALTAVQQHTYPLLDTIGVLCDWLRTHPDACVGATSPPAKAAASKGKGKGKRGKGKKGAAPGPSESRELQPDELLARARRSVLASAVHLGNKLLVLARPLLAGATLGPTALDMLTRLAGVSPPAVSSTGVAMLGPVAEGEVQPPAEGLAWEDVALPEEADLRGFLPLTGCYDALVLPGSAPGKVFLGGLEGLVPALGRAQPLDAPAVPAVPAVLAAAKRIGKVAALLRVLADTPGVEVHAAPGSSRYVASGGEDAAQHDSAKGAEAPSAASAPPPAAPSSPAAPGTTAPATAALVAAAAAQRKGSKRSGGKQRPKRPRKTGGFVKPKAQVGGSGGTEGGAADAQGTDVAVSTRTVMRFGPGQPEAQPPSAPQQAAVLEAGMEGVSSKAEEAGEESEAARVQPAPRGKAPQAHAGSASRRPRRGRGGRPAQGRTSARNVSGRRLVDVEATGRRTTGSHGPRRVAAIAGNTRPTGIVRGDQLPVAGLTPQATSRLGSADAEEEEPEGETIIGSAGGPFGMPVPFPMQGQGYPGMGMPAPFPAAGMPMPTHGMPFPMAHPTHGMMPHASVFPQQPQPPVPFAGVPAPMQWGSSPGDDAAASSAAPWGTFSASYATPASSGEPALSTSAALGFGSPLSGLQGSMVALQGQGMPVPGVSRGVTDAGPAGAAMKDSFGDSLGAYSPGGTLAEGLWGATPPPHADKSSSSSAAAAGSPGRMEGGGGFGGALGLGLVPDGELGSLGLQDQEQQGHSTPPARG